MVSDAVIPAKGQLIQICRSHYNLDHQKLGLTGIPILRDRVIMALYMAEMANTVDAEKVKSDFRD